MADVFVPPEINVERPGAVLIVGRDPGKDEVAAGRPFVGKAGGLLDQMITHLGLAREEVNIANVVGYQPANNEFKNHKEEHVRTGQVVLHELARHLRPSLIITLGNEAAHSFVPDWPSSRTQGLTVYGAKGIEDRRGYFWDTPYGTVLTTLHPAGVLRKTLPGEYLLSTDFKRARKWLRGQLPRDRFPEIKRLRSQAQVNSLLRSQYVGWDIETRWDNTALSMSGYCGDDYQPHVAVYPWEYETYGEQVLAHPRLVTHNGHGFDVPAMRIFRNLIVRVPHDTQTMWWALEPDIAGSVEAGGEEIEVTEKRRMTRKGLAFLASLLFNLPWWKNYPENTDPDWLEKMVVLNGCDSFVTRWLADCLLAAIEEADVWYQYYQAMNIFPTLVELHLRGLCVNETLRQQRQDALQSRASASRTLAAEAALPYITKYEIKAFQAVKKCKCCGGGKTQAKHCWRCAGKDEINDVLLFSGPPKKKDDYRAAYSYKWECNGVPGDEIAKGFKKEKLAALKGLLPECQTCQGAGRVKSYSINPYSETQQKKFLYDTLGAPKTEFKGKVKTDAEALKRVLRWAKG